MGKGHIARMNPSGTLSWMSMPFCAYAKGLFMCNEGDGGKELKDGDQGWCSRYCY